MSTNKLIKLLAANRGRAPAGVKAEVSGDIATLYLYDAIVATEIEAQWFGGVAADTFVREVLALDSPTIRLRINSPGGDVFGARAMAQALREHPASVEVLVDGYAASAASIVAMAGDTVSMSDGAMMMIHNAWTIAMGNASDFIDTAALLEKIDAGIAATYAKRSGGKAEDFAALMAAETWLSAQEAIDLGLADSMSEEAAPKARTQWDLSAYARSPNGADEQRHQHTETEPAVDTAMAHARADRERLLRLLTVGT